MKTARADGAARRRDEPGERARAQCSPWLQNTNPDMLLRTQSWDRTKCLQGRLRSQPQAQSGATAGAEESHLGPYETKEVRDAPHLRTGFCEKWSQEDRDKRASSKRKGPAFQEYKACHRSLDFVCA